MKSVKVSGNCLLVDGERLPILSGEFHFWRNPTVWWPRILDTIKEGGFKLVSTYVCWDFHELEPERYDFVGDTTPQRDLNSFLNLCEDKGFYVILRPGPYIGAEWKNWGIPDHASAYNRLHPKFLEKAGNYIEAVSKVIVPHQATHDGCVVLVQVDNEIDMNWQTYTVSGLGYWGNGRYPSALYYGQIVTEGSVDEPYTLRYWLKQKYDSIEKLNEAYGTKYKDFNDVKPFTEPPSSRQEVRRFFDGNEFWEWFSTTYLERIKEMYINAGVDVILYANTYGSPQPMNIPEMQKVVDLVGGDYYNSNLVTEDELFAMSFHIRHLKTSARIPWSCEFQSGTVSNWALHQPDHHVITPQHQRYMGLLAMLFGLKGWNWYMLVNRDNWYYSPIDDKGLPRDEVYAQFKDLVRAFHELDWPSFEKKTNIALFWYRPHYWMTKQNPFIPSSVIKKTGWFNLFTSLHNCDIDFEIYDPWANYVNINKFPVLLYAGFNFLDDETQRRLLDYVKDGGNLIFMTPPPTENMNGGRSLFYETLPPARSFIAWSGTVKFSCGDKVWVTDTSHILEYDLTKYPEAQPIFALGKTCGYISPYGKGRFSAIGLDPTSEVLAFIQERFQIPIPAQSDTRGILNSASMRKDEATVITVNTMLEAREANLRINLPSLNIKASENYELKEIFSGKEMKLKGHELETLHVKLEKKDGKIYLIRYL